MSKECLLIKRQKNQNTRLMISPVSVVIIYCFHINNELENASAIINLNNISPWKISIIIRLSWVQNYAI